MSEESKDLVLDKPTAIESGNTQDADSKPWLFKPGQSGNPSGRRKEDYSAKIARLVLEENPNKLQVALSRALHTSLSKGDAKVYKILAERGYGKLPQPLEHSGQDGGAIQIVLGCDIPGWAK